MISFIITLLGLALYVVVLRIAWHTQKKKVGIYAKSKQKGSH